MRTLSIYTKHFANVHQSKTKDNKCVICDESFNAKVDLDEHMQIHGEGPYNCKICSEEIIDLESLKVHNVQHSEIIKCAICSKKMVEKMLKDHMGYHTGMEIYIDII